MKTLKNRIQQSALYSGVLIALLGAAQETPSVPEAPITSKREVGKSAAKAIDSALQEKWKSESLTPSSTAPWPEWIRRVYLDLAGRYASSEEIKAILAIPESERQDAVCDQILDGADWASKAARDWRLLFSKRSFNPSAVSLTSRQKFTLSDASNVALAKFFEKPGADLREIAKLTLTKQTKDPLSKKDRDALNTFVNNVYTSHMGSPRALSEEPKIMGANWEPMVRKLGTVFLGAQFQCAQCHDHPFDSSPTGQQKNYMSIKATLQGLDEHGEAISGLKPQVAKYSNVFSPEKTEQEASPGYFGKAFISDPKQPLPEQLANAIVEDDRFALTMANRLWENMFGLPLNALNKVSFLEESGIKNPKLAKLLVATLKESNFNPREFSRALCKTEAYRLSTKPEEPKLPVHFHRAFEKPMTLEQIEEILKNSGSGEVSIQGLGNSLLMAGYAPNESDGRLNTGLNVKSALSVMASEDSQKFAEGLATRIQSETPEPAAQLESVYLKLLGRAPGDEEKKHVLPFLTNKDGKEALVDLIVAMLLSHEFHYY